MFLANKKIDNQVKTFITYNKGRDWHLLQAPDMDLRGNPVRCLLVSDGLWRCDRGDVLFGITHCLLKIHLAAEGWGSIVHAIENFITQCLAAPAEYGDKIIPVFKDKGSAS